MFGVALTPGLLTGTLTAGALELSGSVKIVSVVVGVFAAVSTIVGIIYGAKWKSAHAVEEALNDALTKRVVLVVSERDEARERLDTATAVLLDAQTTIARLEGLPNLERVLELVGDTFGRLAQRLEDLHREHEKQAKERQQALLAELRQRHAA